MARLLGEGLKGSRGRTRKGILGHKGRDSWEGDETPGERDEGPEELVQSKCVCVGRCPKLYTEGLRDL